MERNFVMPRVLLGSFFLYTFLSFGQITQQPELEQPIPGFEEWTAKGWDDQSEFKEEKIVISLGFNCGAARHFQANNLSGAYFPFDWCFSEYESIYRAIRDDFKGFLEVLVAPPVKYREVIDQTYKIKFIHDFKVDVGDQVFLLDYDENKAKYERRISRFRNALKSKKKLFFFRAVITKQEALQLRNLITEKYPQLDYTLVVMNKTDDFKEPWNEKNIKNFFLSAPESSSLTDEMRNEWALIFKKLELIN